jgi:hypothetical protein
LYRTDPDSDDEALAAALAESVELCTTGKAASRASAVQTLPQHKATAIQTLPPRKATGVQMTQRPRKLPTPPKKPTAPEPRRLPTPPKAPPPPGASNWTWNRDVDGYVKVDGNGDVEVEIEEEVQADDWPEDEEVKADELPTDEEEVKADELPKDEEEVKAEEVEVDVPDPARAMLPFSHVRFKDPHNRFQAKQLNDIISAVAPTTPPRNVDTAAADDEAYDGAQFATIEALERAHDAVDVVDESIAAIDPVEMAVEYWNAVDENSAANDWAEEDRLEENRWYGNDKARTVVGAVTCPSLGTEVTKRDVHAIYERINRSHGPQPKQNSDPWKTARNRERRKCKTRKGKKIQCKIIAAALEAGGHTVVWDAHQEEAFRVAAALEEDGDGATVEGRGDELGDEIGDDWPPDDQWQSGGGASSSSSNWRGGTW